MNGELTGLEDIFKSRSDFLESVTLKGTRVSEDDREAAVTSSYPSPRSWQEQVKSLDVDAERATVRGETTGLSRSTSNSPLVHSLDKDLKATFNTSNPLSEPLDHVICGHCRKPFLRQSFASHLKECAKEPEEKLESVKMDVSSKSHDVVPKQNGATVESPTNTEAGAPNLIPKSEKKRKAGDERTVSEIYTYRRRRYREQQKVKEDQEASCDKTQR